MTSRQFTQRYYEHLPPEKVVPDGNYHTVMMQPACGINARPRGCRQTAVIRLKCTGGRHISWDTLGWGESRGFIWWKGGSGSDWSLYPRITPSGHISSKPYPWLLQQLDCVMDAPFNYLVGGGGGGVGRRLYFYFFMEAFPFLWTSDKLHTIFRRRTAISDSILYIFVMNSVNNLFFLSAPHTDWCQYQVRRRLVFSKHFSSIIYIFCF